MSDRNPQRGKRRGGCPCMFNEQEARQNSL